MRACHGSRIRTRLLPVRQAFWNQVQPLKNGGTRVQQCQLYYLVSLLDSNTTYE